MASPALLCQAKQKPSRRSDGLASSTDIGCEPILRRGSPLDEWRRSISVSTRCSPAPRRRRLANSYPLDRKQGIRRVAEAEVSLVLLLTNTTSPLPLEHCAMAFHLLCGGDPT